MNSCELNELSTLGCNAISWGLWACYALFGGSILAIVVLTLINAVQDTKSLIRSAFGIGVLVAIFVVSYFISDGSLSAAASAADLEAFDSKMIGGGLIMFYITFFISIIGVAVSEVLKFIR